MISLSAAYVASLFGSTGGATGGAGPASLLSQPPVSTAALSQTVQQAEAGRSKGIAREAREPGIAHDVAAFRKAVASAKDLKALLADPQARKVLLTANGLADQVDYPGLATKALLSDPADPKSLANRLPDKRFLSAAKTYDFAKSGLEILRQPRVLAAIADGYAEVAWRKSLDVNTPGLSAALDFHQRAGSITSTLQILGDATLRRVVTTALGLPLQIAVQPLEAQQAAIASRLDITKFKDPKFVASFTQRYLNAAAQNAAAAGPAQPRGTLALFA